MRFRDPVDRHDQGRLVTLLLSARGLSRWSDRRVEKRYASDQPVHIHDYSWLRRSSRLGLGHTPVTEQRRLARWLS